MKGLELSDGTVKLDIFQHLKLGVQNKEKNCKCANDIEKKFYCIPCKISCCTKCTLADHKMHLLIAKGDFDMKPEKIQKSFQALEDVLEQDELFNNIEQKRQELIKQVESTYNKLLKMINEWKNFKINEINELFGELIENMKNVDAKKKESKTALNNYAKKHKDFLSLGDKNLDQNNTMFLINYDLLNISYVWSDSLAKIGKSIENDMDDYKMREEMKDKYILDEVHDLLFNREDEDFISHDKIDPKFLPLFKLKVEIKDFNGDKLDEIGKRMGKFNKGVESFKGAVMNSLNKYGNYKEIDKENNIFEHRKVKGAENLFSQRKADYSTIDDDQLLNPDRKIKNKNDIKLDNQIINKYFAHILTDIYDQYFRIPTIELQSSHADLKLKASEEYEDNYAKVKVKENTNEIMFFDKKACKLIKKVVNLKKNPHGYTRFPLGCRYVLVGDKLYITGGKDEYREYPNALIYDRKTEKIKRIMDMQNPRSYHTMVFLEVFETMMVIGGENNDSVEIFDPLSNRWQLLPELNIPRAIPLFYFDEGRGNMYVLFGVEGNYIESNHIDCIEVLDLTEIKQGWMRINYNNKARMDFKCHLNIYPLNDYLLLIYGAVESRLITRNACVYHLIRHEMNLIDKNLMDILRNEAKNSKLLTSIVASVSRSSMSELSEASKSVK